MLSGKRAHDDDDDYDEDYHQTIQGIFYHVADVELYRVTVPCIVHVVDPCHVAGV